MSDVIIIGGGVAGLSVGARLAAHMCVTVLEMEEALGYHASGRSAALFEPNYGAPSVQALSRAGEAFFRDHNGGYLSPRGFLLLGEAGGDALFDNDLQGLGCDEISVQDALGMVPILNEDHVTRAAYHAGAEDIDTDRLLQDFAKTIRHAGGFIMTNTKVSSISHDGTDWQIAGPNGAHHAPRVINAAGPWADQIARMAGAKPVGLVPHRRSMARIAAPDGHDVSQWPMFFGAGETWYAKPDAGQLIVSPAEEDAIEPMDAWPDDMVLAEGMARYQAFARPPITRPTATWAGLRTFAPDRTLVLGADPNLPEFYWSAGQGGYGFQTAPGASALVASSVLGADPGFAPDIVAALSPARFG